VDKTRLHVPDDDPLDMLARTHALVSAILPRCWVVCRPGHAFPEYDCIHDEAPVPGPVAGVHAGLLAARRAGCRALLALPCDMPFLDGPTIRRLLETWASREEGACLTTYSQVETGYIEALTSVYDVEGIPLFEAALARGERMLNRVVPPSRQCHIPYDATQARPFFNVNSPADLELARRMAAEG
jgi:molybdopterin-guanine dinucleotide biosynthesis protein A